MENGLLGGRGKGLDDDACIIGFHTRMKLVLLNTLPFFFESGAQFLRLVSTLLPQSPGLHYHVWLIHNLLIHFHKQSVSEGNKSSNQGTTTLILIKYKPTLSETSSFQAWSLVTKGTSFQYFIWGTGNPLGVHY